MEKQELEKNFTLPPNVNGRCRGKLSLWLHEIKWTNNEPFRFNWIQTKLIWWGGTVVTIKLKHKKHLKKSIGHVIHYNILTKLSLFRNYLRSSKSVEAKFSSGISNIDIGKANIPIPVELIEFIDQQSLHRNTQKSQRFCRRCYIFNAQNKMMGELLVEYDLTLYDCVLNEDSDTLTTKYTNRNCDEIENDMNQFNVDLDLASPLKKSHKTKLKTKLTTSKMSALKLNEKNTMLNLKKLSGKSRISLMDYLTGRPLAEIEENEAVKAMASTSPTESLIDLLSYDLNGLYLPKRTNDDELKVLKKIDCLRIQVYDLCLTRAGIREILSKNASHEKNFSSGTFTIDIDLDSILCTKSPFEKNNFFTSKVTRIFCSAIDSSPPSIVFNQRSSVHKLNTFCIKSRNSYTNGTISLIVRYRDIESSKSRMLGTARIQLADTIGAKNLSFHRQCTVKTATSEIIVGILSIKVELGCRGLHFGADFFDAISSNAIDSNHSDSNRYFNHVASSPREYSAYSRFVDDREFFKVHINNECYKHQMNNNFDFHSIDDIIYNTCVYDAHEDKSNIQSTAVNIESQSNNAQRINGNNSNNMDDATLKKDFIRGSNKTDEMIDETDNELKGLFHIEQINYCSSSQSVMENFLVCRPFWNDSVLVTEKSLNKTNEGNYQMNYLELFSVICDQKLFECTKHGFMSIEVWRQDGNHARSIIGSAKVPLHQFYIAFNNNIMRNHVSQQELPVISIDGWVTILSTAVPNDTPIGTVQTILAVGTSKQVNNLKRSKELQSCQNFQRFPLEHYPLPIISHSVITCKNTIDNSLKSAIPQFNDRNSNFATMFSNFIDTLASRLPSDRNSIETSTRNDASTQTNNSVTEKHSGKYMRPTSELLDELQKALAIAPTPAQQSVIPHTVMPKQQIIESKQIQSDSKNTPMFRIHIEIESALHLPSIALSANKKSGKRNRNSINTANKMEILPNAYVTFEAMASATQTSLTLYTTNIVEQSCSPQWNKHFEVYLPIEFLQNDEKRFVMNVWRQNSSNDVMIGFASVDLSVFLAGLPTISGWFNIIDHSGCINGQIKVHIKPKDDLSIYQKRPQSVVHSPIVNASICESSKIEQFTMDVTSNESQSVDDSALSRTLKRKFTELEEISQRLRARLFDVTGNMSMDDDDQFENDLNTIPNEGDDDFEVSNIASEMTLDWLEHCQNQVSSNASTDLQAQMQDIFHEFLSPHSLAANDSSNQIDSPNLFNDRLKSVLNDKTMSMTNDATDGSQHSVQNITESLEKSAIND